MKALGGREAKENKKLGEIKGEHEIKRNQEIAQKNKCTKWRKRGRMKSGKVADVKSRLARN